MAIQATGITRKVDKLGRVIIPSDVRAAMGVESGDMMEVRVDVAEDGDVKAVVFTKFNRGCQFCGGMVDLKQFDGRVVCGPCREKIAGL